MPLGMQCSSLPMCDLYSVDLSGEPVRAHVCKMMRRYPVNLGRYPSYHHLPDGRDGLLVVYSGGDSCEGGFIRSNVSFVCNPDAGA